MPRYICAAKIIKWNNFRNNMTQANNLNQLAYSFDLIGL